MKVAYFTTHPIQYQVPLTRYLYSTGLDIFAIYGSIDNVAGSYDPGFAQVVSWDIPLLDGYPYKVMPKKINFVTEVKMCLQYLHELKPDIVWIHGWGFSVCRAAWVAALLTGKPIMMRADTHVGCASNNKGNDLKVSNWQRFKYACKSALHKLTLSTAFKTISAFLIIGSANRRFYIDYNVQETKLFFVPHAVDNNYFKLRCLEAAKNTKEFKQKIGVPSDHLVVLFAGKLAPWKGADLLLEAFLNLLSLHPNLKATLLIVGEGEDRNKLQQQAGNSALEKVKFIGFVNQSKLPDYFALCDVFVLPSTFEPWGLIVNEVMNASKPVIVSSAAGCAEDLVKHNYNGSIFDTGNVQILQGQLYDFLTNSDLRVNAGMRSAEIIQNWSIEEAAQAVMSAMSTLKARL